MTTPDVWAERLQAAGERHLETLDEEYGERGDDDEGPEYCHCPTCLVREVLTGVWPVIEQYAEHQVQQATKGT